MAVISHRHRCIFVKVPKCASTAVRDWFIAHGAGRHSFRPYWYFGTLADRLQWLARALEMYPGYLTFAFVRNPYRRFLSVYRHANRIAAVRAARLPGHPENLGTAREYAELVAELLDDSGALWGPRSTRWFRDNAERRYGPLGIPLRALGFTFTHARPQVDFLPDRNPARLFGVKRSNPVPLDFIGAVETLDADFARLQAALNLPRIAIAKINAAPPGHAPPAACDAATRRLVEHLYADDLTFTGCTSEEAPATPPDREPAVPVRPGAPPRAGTALRRARYALATLETGLEDRLFRIPPLRRRAAPLVRRLRRLA